jgi:mRNA-degrading endonuclease RelE of RelBE toxin-antitoxin system
LEFPHQGDDQMGSNYQVEFLQEAVEDFQLLRKFDQQRVVAAIEVQLLHEPMRETRNRKRLRPNDLAEWELRVDAFRVFYDVLAETEVVKVVAVGYKDGNDLFIHGERYEL